MLLSCLKVQWIDTSLHALHGNKLTHRDFETVEISVSGNCDDGRRDGSVGIRSIRDFGLLRWRNVFSQGFLIRLRNKGRRATMHDARGVGCAGCRPLGAREDAELRRRWHRRLALTTTLCFAVWVLNGLRPSATVHCSGLVRDTMCVR
ncbi:unnamed protein product [Ostreobium quekettii]|uniref:Uncharacterized protein n=1 Tax=Ostreobium quekettii TaxID=121088 RepID=A0A8S1IVQ6_9CHLO|nr:unnamed protein product [Ostreobium quekettii]